MVCYKIIRGLPSEIRRKLCGREDSLEELLDRVDFRITSTVSHGVLLELGGQAEALEPVIARLCIGEREQRVLSPVALEDREPPVLVGQGGWKFGVEREPGAQGDTSGEGVLAGKAGVQSQSAALAEAAEDYPRSRYATFDLFVDHFENAL